METTVDSAAYEALRAENQVLREKLAGLEHELAQLKRLVFGTKSERFAPIGAPDQLPLFEGTSPLGKPDDNLPVTAEAVTYRRPRKKPVRQILPFRRL